MILPDDHMPVDVAGNRADVCCFAKSVVSRLNTGQFYEHYINAASRDMSKWIRESYGTLPFDQIWGRLMDYYHAASPEQHESVSRICKTREDKDYHIQTIISSGIFLYISPAAEHLSPQIFHNIEKVISPVYGPVTYKDISGRTVTTIDNVFIGIKDMIILEKTEHRPMAISSATLQHHGLISGSNKETRNAHPSKQQSTRVLGETEVRLYAAAMGGEVLAEMMDLSNNPESHRAVCKSILTADKPSRINKLVNRDEIPLGSSRSLSFINHILLCTGTTIVDD